MRPSVRFDVFKRDDFTCLYCGRKPPDVTLEVDHLIPRSQGGTDDPENLYTSCWDCNRGKGATPLDTPPPQLEDLEEKAELIRERERQLRVYNEALEERRLRREDDFTRVWNHWFEVWGEEELSRWHTPWQNTLRSYIDLIGAPEVMAAMDIIAAKFRYVTADAVRYFGGVLKGKRAEKEGRKKRCTICGEWLTLAPDQDTNAEYHHTACEKEDG